MPNALPMGTISGTTTTIAPKTPGASNTPLPDQDGDGIPDATDNCPTIANADQVNTDGDAQGKVVRSSWDIKPTLATMTTRIHEVERNMGKPCPFHDMTVKQVEGLAELQKQHTATELRVAELGQKHTGLTEMQAAFSARMGADVSAIQSSIGAIRTEVGQLTTTVSTLSATGSDTKEWVKYLIISLLAITLSVITNVITDWVKGDRSHPDKAVAATVK